jgi:hypothetical protein
MTPLLTLKPPDPNQDSQASSGLTSLTYVKSSASTSDSGEPHLGGKLAYHFFQHPVDSNLQAFLVFGLYVVELAVKIRALIHLLFPQFLSSAIDELELGAII